MLSSSEFALVNESRGLSAQPFGLRSRKAASFCYHHPMPEASHQLSSERVLYRTNRSLGVLVLNLVRGTIFGLIVGAIVGGVIALFLSTEQGPAWSVSVVVCFIFVAIFLWYHFLLWKRTTLTITSQRIVLRMQSESLRGLFGISTQTMQWATYQESVYEGALRHQLCNTGTLSVRYGTADATRTLSVSGLPYAQDLKHYLDKIYTLQSEGVPYLNLPTFVRAKKGKRDTAVLSYVE